MSVDKASALSYHAKTPAGKLTILPSKPCKTQDDLSLAYSPGVSVPCLEIQKNPDAIYEYTIKGNTVGVVTDGTAVLGLGNIGPEASLPVMEGKCLLLKKCADVNGVPLPIKGAGSIEEFVRIVASLEPLFGAINLEDIKSPECFDIEQKLQEKVSVPVFHDDQHGTAIIAYAALINSVAILGKALEDVSIVINGAGAAGIACARLFHSGGVPKDHITLIDRYGVVYKGRQEYMNEHKASFAQKTSNRTLMDALSGADVFLGVSAGNILNEDMVKRMNRQPVIFALANPDPEILPDIAKASGAAIVATGRSDFSNQVNNVLGFPGIFRAALDTRSKRITDTMKLAAARALALLTRETVPDDIRSLFQSVYPEEYTSGVFDKKQPFSADYIIPKPFDPRVVPRVAEAVAEAAHQSGVATKPVKNTKTYQADVRKRIQV